jgi:hypothetical protein
LLQVAFRTCILSTAHEQCQPSISTCFTGNAINLLPQITVVVIIGFMNGKKNATSCHDS